MCRYRGTSFSAAPALHTASDTPRMALAPNLAVGKTKEELRLLKQQAPTHRCPCQHSLELTRALTVPCPSLGAFYSPSVCLYAPDQGKKNDLHLFSVPSISSIRLSIFS